MTASGVSVNLEKREMTGEEGVQGEIPAGTFRAQSLRADLSTRELTLEGNARLTMIPGKVRIPQ